MNKLNYRLCKDPDQIIKRLLEVEIVSSDITLWQNIDQDTRYVPLGPINWKIDLKRSAIIISAPKLIKTGLKLNKDKDIYIHSHKQSIVFKSTRFKSNKSQILITIPKLVHLIENREFMRFKLTDNDYNSTFFKKDEAYSTSQSSDKLFRLPCIDVSETGIALKVNTGQLTKYITGNFITVEQIAGVDIESNSAEILYSCPFYNERSGQKYFKIGLKFSKVLSKNTIARILLSSNNDKLKTA